MLDLCGKFLRETGADGDNRVSFQTDNCTIDRGANVLYCVSLPDLPPGMECLCVQNFESSANAAGRCVGGQVC